MENRAEQRRRAVLEALTRAMEPLIAAKAEENQREHGGTAPGRGKNLCQKSDKGFDTKKEAAALAGEGKVALNHGSNPTRASPGTPTLGGQDQRTTDSKAHPRGRQEIGPLRGSQRTKGKDDGVWTLDVWDRDCHGCGGSRLAFST